MKYLKKFRVFESEVKPESSENLETIKDILLEYSVYSQNIDNTKAYKR